MPNKYTTPVKLKKSKKRQIKKRRNSLSDISDHSSELNLSNLKPNHQGMNEIVKVDLQVAEEEKEEIVPMNPFNESKIKRIRDEEKDFEVAHRLQ